MKVKANIEHISIRLNPAQMRFILLMLQSAKQMFAVWSRGTGKSFLVGFLIDYLIRLMPRCVITLSQRTYGQALTKTLPSTFKALSMLGYRKYDPKTQFGDYVVCKQPPSGWPMPYEHILSFEHCITFSNGSVLYILTQDGNSRGPNADFNITDEALTLDKEQFDQEVAPTNRGNEHLFGKLSKSPLPFHHGNLFVSSAPYTMEQKWLLDACNYYEEERGFNLIDRWNSMVNVQIQLLDAARRKDTILFKEIWNECLRIRQTMLPFVSRDGTLFMFASIFDNIDNVGMSYVLNQYKIMDLVSFKVEILNYILDKIDNCYYHFSEASKYYAPSNNEFLKEYAEDSNYDFAQLSEPDSRYDADCNPSAPLELCCDWGAHASFLEVAQPSNYDWATETLLLGRVVDNTINEFYVKRSELDDTEVNALMDAFTYYYRHHGHKVAHFYADRHGDSATANSKETYNEQAIKRLKAAGWVVKVFRHKGQEPPQHDKYLLMSDIASEKDPKLPIKRFNASKCPHIILSMNNTRLIESSTGKFAKDKRSERNGSIAPEDATHFGDVVDKRMWTKYGGKKKSSVFVPNRY